MLDLLEGWLRHKSDMVNLEAARVICEMKNVTSQQLTKAIAGKERIVFLICRHPHLSQCFSCSSLPQSPYLNLPPLALLPPLHFLIPPA